MNTTAAPGKAPADATGVRAVVLAAGAGERMGRRPKGLLERDGVPLLRRTLMALREAGIGESVVVLGHHARALSRCLDGMAVAVVHHPDPDQGQVSSQRLGLAALSPGPAAVMVLLADQPLIDAVALGQLVDAWHRRSQGTEVLVPWVDGRRGNPVVFSARVHQAILQGGPDFGCRQWQTAHAACVQAFECTHPGFVWDVDTEEDICRLRQATGLVLSWPSA